jgi:phosphoenolpyruvate carboxykinase (ATP)
MVGSHHTSSPLIHNDLSVKQLIELSLLRKEGVLASTNQALCVDTGKYTGRSPKSRFIVQDASTENQVDWGDVNQPIQPDHFETLWNKARQNIQMKEQFVSHHFVGANANHKISVKLITELAWHSLFAKQLFIRPEDSGESITEADWTILNASSLKMDPASDGTFNDAFIGLDFSQKRILICGTAYAGEMKKAMFTVMNFILPAKDVLPMHCSANLGEQGDVALFFGLSGTGKTTLSADPERALIGDDEHGWGKEGVFNFEGGCYAKCIQLSEKNEPMIWNAIRYGAVIENVVLNADGVPDYDNASLTENTRAAYPREFIFPQVKENQAGQPRNVIFLTCDLYGVLPPLSKLTKEQAAYHFLSGYTALVGSTEVGSETGIKPTFSTCFGAPFFPRPPLVYAELLMKWVERSGAQVYLVNTGWTGGGLGTGKRFSIPVTRHIINSILNGDVSHAETQVIPGFNLEVPCNLPGIESTILSPSKTWKNPEAYQHALTDLMKKFSENFKKFTVSEAILKAGPQF